MPNTDTITLGFLIFPGFPMACLTSAIEPLRAANEIDGTKSFVWKVISEDGQGVEASAGVMFQPDISLREANDLDMLFLLSSPTGAFQDASFGNGSIRRFARHGMILGAVSGGVFPLARSGILDDHVCSIHWCYKAAFQSEFPKIETNDDVLVTDRRCYTVAGSGAMFDMALHIIGETMGDAIMTEVACWFQHPYIRERGVQQKIPAFRNDTTADALPETVARAVEMFAENLEHPIGVQDVADAIGVSARQLERNFKAATDYSPLLYYRRMRMNAARQLVLYSREPMVEIAQAVGYASSTTLSQHYRAQFGVTPQEDRNQLNQFRIRDNLPLPSL
ncbi:GlxA family transcriptional regulator [Cochlodiniinecator piscidefendens]|uniref:GlxA family transcriptional regulator n=1 Tax=Cochlodiniinecator piscidefendens TaxID=2715756 RepID=UPI00140BD18F|nr:GlxA family transcriptional regulator [Cochlodiniinecator piscidefendens]